MWIKINNNKKLVIFSLLCATIVVLIFVILYVNKNAEIVETTYNEFIKNVESRKITKVIISSDPSIKYFFKYDDTTYITDNPRIDSLKEKLLINDIHVEEGRTLNEGGILGSIIFFIAAIIMFRFINKGKSGKETMAAINIENSDEDSRVLKFDDIAGNDEVKENTKDLVDFIKNPEKYNSYGARMPKGIIFYGPPGTGKTLMAKAIAGEAGVPFFAVSGSDFVQMYVGVGALRVRELFKKARTKGKAVIFIDEIDAIGKKRTASVSGGSDEKDQTLNALLTEMSGFEGREGIVVIAATNRLDVIDEALLRPGRFDRQEEIGLPDVNARHSIINLHCLNKPISESIDRFSLAKQTVFFSGAMIENLLNEAAIFAAKRDGEHIIQSDIDKAYYTIIAGSEKKDRSALLLKDREITAYHEAGHALVTKITSPQNTVSKVTIIPSSKGAGGFSVNIPPDKMFYTKLEIESQIMISLAGRAAEEIIFGNSNVTTGASNDIEKATILLKDYISKYGMCQETGLLNLGVLDSIKDQQNSLGHYKTIMKTLYNRTTEVINNNLSYLNEIAQLLLREETINEEDIDKIMSV